MSGGGADERDRLFDAISRAYVGDEPWFVGPAHLGHEVAPEMVALQPAHMRRITAICDAVVAELERRNEKEDV